MVTTFTESLLLGILSLFGGTSFGMSTLGVALIFEIGYFMLGSMGIFTSETLTQANVYLTIALLPMAFVEAGYLRQHWNIRFVLFFGVSTALFTIIGILILKNNDNTWLARSLGFLLLICFVILLYIQYRHYKQLKHLKNFNPLDIESHDEHHNDSVLNLVSNTSSNDSRKIENDIPLSQQKISDDGVEWKVNSIKRALVLIVLGMISGLLRGLYGVAGIPIMFFALLTNINKDEFRASTAFAMILSESVSVIQLLIINNNLEIAQIWQYVTIIIGGFIGLIIGNKLSPYLNQQSFHVLIIYLIFCGAIILSTRGFIDDITDLIVSITLTIIGAILFCYWLYHSRKERKLKQLQQEKLPSTLQSL